MLCYDVAYSLPMAKDEQFSFLWDKPHSVDTVRWHFVMHSIYHGDSKGNTQMLRIQLIAIDLELTWQCQLSEVRPESCSPFTMGVYHSLIPKPRLAFYTRQTPGAEPSTHRSMH